MTAINTERKQAKEQLQLQARLLDAVQESVVATDLEGRIRYWGRGAERLYGYSTAEVMGQPYRSFAGSVDFPDEAAFRRDILARGSWLGEHVQRKKNGETFWSSTTITRVLDPDGQPIGFLGVDRDITARKQTEEALFESVSLLRATLESTADGILVVAANGKLTSHNQRFLEMWHLPKDVVASGNDEDALTFVLAQLKEPEAFLAKVRELYAHPDAESSDVLEFKDGRIFERYSQSQRINGRPVGRVWSFSDVTERMRAEESLQRSERKYRDLVENINAILFSIDLDDRILYVSSAILTLLGYPPAEVVGRLYPEFIDPRDLPAVQEAWAEVVAGTPRAIECRMPTRSGEVRWVRISSRVNLEAGTAIGVQGIVTDINERKQTEATLDQQLNELRRWQAVTLGREDRIAELKQEVNALAARLGQPPLYAAPEDNHREANG